MLTDSPGGALLAVRVQPGAKKSEITGKHGNAVRVRLQAPPVEGKANQELLRLLAAELGLKKRQLQLKRGEHSRDKLILLSGIKPADAEKKLKKVLGVE